ncbi:hypothetical protein MUG87_19195 [Ectobacillus sp. JY-23]|uniref:restriction endonuclease-related protein n=1 Tax=Ectobacillus sp. JY-23 TaxID=2933872 RepID=UPI001FF11CF3|nr:hypothetical protein [Ectobacillus sp. JY-23]UOY92510.1 hypothetical protein MUG87_19195 [Ectobacillus sp. JY-23]
MQAGIELKEMLYLIARGIQDWKKNWMHVPDSFYKGHSLFIKHCFLSNNRHPNNLYDFIHLLHRPSAEWGIPALAEVFPNDASFLSEGFGFSIEADDFLEEYENPQEFDQSVMKEILLYCREQGLDEEYRKARSFLSQPENAVLTYYNLVKKLNVFENLKVKEHVFSCYEILANSLGNYRQCPHCGWTLSLIKGQWKCNKEYLCEYFQSNANLKEFSFMESEKVYRLRAGIQRYVLLTGIFEENLYQRLRQYDAILYPDIDQFDIQVQAGEKAINIDMKDYKSPKTLANVFNNKSNHDLEKYSYDVYIVIPDYRKQLNSRYVEQFYAHLQQVKHKYIKLMTERQLLRKLKEEE